MFMKHFNITDKIKVIKYANPQDILRAMHTREIDYTIFNPESFVADFNPILMGNRQRIWAYPNIPTGFELKIEDFFYDAYSVFAVPKTNLDEFNNFQKAFLEACNSEKVKSLIEKRKYVSVCWNNNLIYDSIKKEYDMLKRNNINLSD